MASELKKTESDSNWDEEIDQFTTEENVIFTGIKISRKKSSNNFSYEKRVLCNLQSLV